MKKAISAFILGVIILLLVAGCAKKVEDLTGATTGATDTQTAMAIVSAFNTVFSQIQFTPTDNPVGSIDQTINGPNGGSVHVTGTATLDQTTQKVNWSITLNWSNYRFLQGSNDFTLNGQMTYSGYSDASGVEAHFAAPNINIKGTMNGSSVDVTISFSFDLKVNSSGHGSISGNIDGRSFSNSF